LKVQKPKPRSVLGIDVGKKRIGLAYSDPLNITVNLLPAIKRKKDYSEVRIFKNHISANNISGLIIGLPLDNSGNMTEQAIDCKKYGEIINSFLELPFAFVNEHSSTWASKERFGVKKDKSGLIDSLSARIILEQWIIEGPELKEYVFNKQIKY
tara:strand:- start:4024 stop:4485 length:462 start_codon:yes stop_codon:yes gene_type:complete